MKELQAIFKNIKEDFCSLWKFQERGNSLEIITPYVVTSQRFVSIFLTKQGSNFIVTDGGWMDDGTYGTFMKPSESAFSKVFEYYKTFYSINELKNADKTFYYKKTAEALLIPNIVFELCNFISVVMSSSMISFSEKEEGKRFNKEANSYLEKVLPKRKNNKTTIEFRQDIHESIKTVKFSAVATTPDSKLTLINYVTGSTPENFQLSIARANLFFEVAKNSPVKSLIKNEVALINSEAYGFDEARFKPLLNKLSDTTEGKNIYWSHKQNLKTYLN